ncbi:MAG: hypothetical protein AAF961_01460, partial [Planctomycetota bacterium]
MNLSKHQTAGAIGMLAVIGLAFHGSSKTLMVDSLAQEATQPGRNSEEIKETPYLGVHVSRTTDTLTKQLRLPRGIGLVVE